MMAPTKVPCSSKTGVTTKSLHTQPRRSKHERTSFMLVLTAVVVTLVFVITAFVFFVYDRLEERRPKLVMTVVSFHRPTLCVCRHSRRGVVSLRRCSRRAFAVTWPTCVVGRMVPSCCRSLSVSLCVDVDVFVLNDRRLRYSCDAVVE